MDRVYAEVEGALRANEVVEAEAALWREVPDRGAAGGSLGNYLRGRELAGGVDEAAGTLEPGLETLGVVEEVPAEDDWGEADTPIGSAADLNGGGAAAGGAAGRLIGDGLIMRGRGVGLPEGHDIATELKLAAEGAGLDWGKHGAAKLEASPEEFVIGAISYAVSVVDEGAVLPLVGWRGGRSGGVASRRFGVGERGGGEQDEQQNPRSSGQSSSLLCVQ